MKKKQKQETPVTRYSPDETTGLSSTQVEERKTQGLTNDTRIKSSKTYLSIFVKNIFTFFNLIWFVLAIALFTVGAYSDLFFLVVILLNTTIAIIQEIRAKVTVEKLSMTTLPSIKAIRDGKEVEIKGEEIVLDDIIVLTNGDQVPSDCTILSGTVEVNESLLTGESRPIRKQENDALLCGSFLVSGKCYAKVEKVGTDNYIQTIAAKAKEFKAPASNLFRDLNRLIRYIGIALIPLGVATIIKECLKTDSAFDIVSNTAGAITGMIPAGMFLLITIALSVGVVKLAKKKTLVKDVYSIEMLARTDVLCLDKTGTITDGTMNVTEMINFSKQDDKAIENILANILAAQNSNNMTSVAMVKRFSTANDMPIKNVVEFSSIRKFSVTTFENGKTYYLGAPTFTGCKLNEKQQEIINEKMELGYRVIALVESSKQYSESAGAKGEKLLAFIVIEDHIRPDAIDTIKWFKENKVQIKIISGDDPLTVSKIAQRVGVENYDKYISLENLSIHEIEQIAEDFTVFGRVSPEQKYALVKALKSKGHVVAMTGDGVNDTLALKEADCSIAMADGSEVARNISKLVLLDSNFSSLPAVVKEGRQVINNVQNSSVLFLMKTLFTIVLCAITLIIGASYPFSPKNLFLLEMFVIGLPSFLLTFQPNNNLIKGNFIPQVLKKSIPSMCLMLISVLVPMFAIKGLTALEYECLPTLALTLTGFINLVWLCFPITWYKALIATLSLGLIVGSICLLPGMFGLYSLENIAMFGPTVWITLGAIAAGSILFIATFILIEKLIEKHKKKHQKRG